MKELLLMKYGRMWIFATRIARNHLQFVLVLREKRKLQGNVIIPCLKKWQDSREDTLELNRVAVCISCRWNEWSLLAWTARSFFLPQREGINHRCYRGNVEQEGTSNCSRRPELSPGGLGTLWAGASSTHVAAPRGSRRGWELSVVRETTSASSKCISEMPDCAQGSVSSGLASPPGTWSASLAKIRGTW